MLLFGSDACLLESRRLLLEHAGYKVFSTLQLLELDQILSDTPIDLLILCHSLDKKKRESVDAVVRANHRKVKILALSAGFVAPSITGSDQTVRTEDGPQ